MFLCPTIVHQHRSTWWQLFVPAVYQLPLARPTLHHSGYSALVQSVVYKPSNMKVLKKIKARIGLRHKQGLHCPPAQPLELSAKCWKHSSSEILRPHTKF